jgi:hypothetical protein
VCTGLASDVVEVNNPTDLTAAFGVGPLVDLAALILAVAGGPVFCARLPTSGVGASSAVVHTGTGTAVMTVAGAPADAYDVRVRITRAAANLAANTAAARISLDGGDVYSAEFAIPVSGVYGGAGTFLAGTGLTVTWADGTFVVDDTYTFTTTGPTFTTANLTTALSSVTAATTVSIEGVCVAGPADNTFAVVADTWAVAEEVAGRYRWVLMEARDQAGGESAAAWVTAISGAAPGFSGVQSVRVAVGAGYCELLSPISGRIQRRPVSWAAAARIAAVPISEHPGRVARGSLKGVSSLYHDASSLTTLDTARFLSARTFVGRAGTFITRGNVMTAPGSDFRPLQNRRVLDAAMRRTLTLLGEYVGSSVRVNPTTGRILEADAKAIEAALESALNAALVAAGHASSVAAVVNRTDNILSTQTLRVEVRVIPLGYLETISGVVAFFNPALAPVAA